VLLLERALVSWLLAIDECDGYTDLRDSSRRNVVHVVAPEATSAGRCGHVVAPELTSQEGRAQNQEAHGSAGAHLST
jgi:hypothetical protein